MSGVFHPKYSDPQRTAIVTAFVDHGMTAPAVADLARAGELMHDGEPLPPFELPISTVRSLARDARRRRSGAMRSELANAAPGDALEDLRRRLVSAIDHELRQIERRQKAGEVVKGEELRQLGRARRELAARSGPIDSRPPVPGARVNGERDGGLTRGGIAGPLLADHRATGAAPGWPTPPASAPKPADTSDTPDEGAPDDDGSPAALARELVAQFEAGKEIRRDAASPRNEHAEQDASRDNFDHSRLAAEDVTAIEHSERGRY
jgi:hypothetical protein